MKSPARKMVRVINPDKPVTPEVKSLPPSISIIEIPAIAFIVPCIMAAAMTDFDLMAIYSNMGVSRMHSIIIINTPIWGC